MTIVGTDRRGRRVARSVGALLVSAGLLAGCALVDDARREFGSDTDPEAGSAPRPAVSTTGSRSRPSANPTPSWSPSTAAPGVCPPSGVLVRMGEVDAAMGLRAAGIELVNCGSVPVTLNGYPDVRVLDVGGAALPVAVVHGSADIALLPNFDTPPAPVTAAPGARLVAGLLWRNRVDMGGDVVKGTYLEIVPAPGQPAQTIRPDGPIDLGTTGRLGVSAWTAPQR
ncbi:DUF4232 domain-containing protein [Virgisporangium aurantiacum]|uniref:DUF4232 domain-containing protein n=1 Tax=Virgisporangium aurantiacum TaxID=175570 RepID=A0A8J3Z6P5_9ACTN|nr:DUF4232 domain-containing protein [Virgisporangium aurantiacum]GIJ57397.1 hypothetical protein Vau01_049130 [Virgisporangium aurantiacum]